MTPSMHAKKQKTKQFSLTLTSISVAIFNTYENAITCSFIVYHVALLSP